MAKNKRSKLCLNCGNYDETAVKHGLCRLMPPIMMAEIIMVGNIANSTPEPRLPEVDSNEWCGQWVKK